MRHYHNGTRYVPHCCCHVAVDEAHPRGCCWGQCFTKENQLPPAHCLAGVPNAMWMYSRYWGFFEARIIKGKSFEYVLMMDLKNYAVPNSIQTSTSGKEHKHILVDTPMIL